MAKIRRLASGGTAVAATTFAVTTVLGTADVGDTLVLAVCVNPYPATTLPVFTVSGGPAGNVWTIRQALADSSFNECLALIECDVNTQIPIGTVFTIGTVGGLSYSRWAADIGQFRSLTAYDKGASHAGNASSGLSSGAIVAAGGQGVAAFTFGSAHLPYGGLPDGWTADPANTAGNTGNAADRALIFAWRDDLPAGSVSFTGTTGDSAGIYAGAIISYLEGAADTGMWGVSGGVLVPLAYRAVVGGSLTS